jgi:hypothetical protein
MMKIGNINSTTEAVNFLINKVEQPYISDYVNHVTSQPGHPKNAQDAFVPNLHVQQIIPLEARLLMIAKNPDLPRQSLKSKHSQYVRHNNRITTKDWSTQQIVEQKKR